MEIKFNLNQLKKASKELKMHINQNVVLISGEMGVGKTTLIKELLSLYGVKIMFPVQLFQLLMYIW